MTFRVDFGIDPGLAGALAVLADGEAVAVHDMPTRIVGETREVDAAYLAAMIRGFRHQHRGAVFFGCVETVFAMGRGKDGAAGAASMQRLGDARGCARAVFEVLGVEYSRAAPATWKRHYGLQGQGKDASREAAIRIFPAMAADLRRKKDDGRAEALLLARWNFNLQFTGARR